MIPLVADLVADGVWIADLSEQAEDDDGLRPLASADVVAHSAERRAPWLPLADDPVAAGWTRSPRPIALLLAPDRVRAAPSFPFRDPGARPRVPATAQGRQARRVDRQVRGNRQGDAITLTHKAE